MVNDGGASNRNSLGSGSLGNECLAILRLLQRLVAVGNVSAGHIAPLIYSKEVETEKEREEKKEKLLQLVLEICLITGLNIFAGHFWFKRHRNMDCLKE